MIPMITIKGLSNLGKPTLFNQLTKTRQAPIGTSRIRISRNSVPGHSSERKTTPSRQ